MPDTLHPLSVTLNGKTLCLRPTFKALMAIEHHTGQGVLELATALSTSTLGLKSAVIIITQCLHGAGHTEWTEQAVGDAIVQSGLNAYIAVLRDIFTQVLNGVSESADEYTAL